jgi:hypothetical protein
MNVVKLSQGNIFKGLLGAIIAITVWSLVAWFLSVSSESILLPTFLRSLPSAIALGILSDCATLFL